MSSNVKPTDLSRSPERSAARLRALELLADRWALWILLAVHETTGSRFSELEPEPGLSRRVLADRLRQLVDAGLLRTEQYQARPVRHRYVPTDRGAQVRRLALAAVHVAAGGVLYDDPLARAPATHDRTPGNRDGAVPAAAGSPATAPPDAHPADALLLADLDAARRIHDTAIAPLARYDRQYNSSLVETLATWFACDASTSVAAARLYAHRHTVRYRLDRVRDLTGLDPSVSADRDQLALGLRARRVLGEADALDPD